MARAKRQTPLMAWNFRLVRHTERNPKRVWYGVHEVFYTDQGQPWTMTQDPVAIDGESVKEVLGYLEMVGQDLKHLPILDANKTRWAKFPRDVSKERPKSLKTLKEIK
jgi:hypothetical protein